VTFIELPEKTVTDATVYAEFCYALTNKTEEQSAKAPMREIKFTSASEYVRKLANLAREKYGGKPEHKHFFAALDKDNNGWRPCCTRPCARRCRRRS